MAFTKEIPSRDDAAMPGTLKGDSLFAFNKTYYGDKIRAYRLAAGLNQPQLAEKVGVKKNAVSNWEAGRGRPDINFIPILCDVMGISISAFFGAPERVADLPTEEQRLLSKYRDLSAANQRIVGRLIDAMEDEESAEQAL